MYSQSPSSKHSNSAVVICILSKETERQNVFADGHVSVLNRADRQEELSRVKKKLAVAPSSAGGGRCSFCASTHHARARAPGDGGSSVLRKRALAAEVKKDSRYLLSGT